MKYKYNIRYNGAIFHSNKTPHIAALIAQLSNELPETVYYKLTGKQMRTSQFDDFVEDIDSKIRYRLALENGFESSF